MKNVFSKSDFPKAPGGDRYEFKDAETAFKIPKTGIYVIKILAKAKNAKQNKATDDDDLRIALDSFHFGKYERRKDKVSWKGFGTSSSWNGANLKGGAKTIYYFVELDEGEHDMQFFADGTPKIVSLEVFEVKDLSFELKNLVPDENIANSGNGIPWLSFVFLGTNAKSVFFDVEAKIIGKKEFPNDDKLKIVINGKIFQNPQSSHLKKYRDFYFYGDTKSTGLLSLSNNEIADPLAFENTVEIWYDRKPKINSLRIEFFDVEGFLKEYKDLDFEKMVRFRAWMAIKFFKFFNKPYSAKFLEHSLKKNPESLIFKANHSITRKIKIDPIYKEIIAALTKKLAAGQLDGEMWPKNFKDDERMNGQINFDSDDLATALHGIKKIEYKAEMKKNGRYVVKLTLFDIYDFQKGDVPFYLFNFGDYAKQFVVNSLDFGEELGIVNNFEIQINIKDYLWLP